MTEPKDYKAMRWALQTIRLLAGREMDGLAPGEIAKSLQIHPANVTRFMRVLQDAGFAERLPWNEERWRLAPILVQIARAYEINIASAKERYDETTQRYSREPK